MRPWGVRKRRPTMLLLSPGRRGSWVTRPRDRSSRHRGAVGVAAVIEVGDVDVTVGCRVAIGAGAGGAFDEASEQSHGVVIGVVLGDEAIPDFEVFGHASGNAWRQWHKGVEGWCGGEAGAGPSRPQDAGVGPFEPTIACPTSEALSGVFAGGAFGGFAPIIRQVVDEETVWVGKAEQSLTDTGGVHLEFRAGVEQGAPVGGKDGRVCGHGAMGTGLTLLTGLTGHTRRRWRRMGGVGRSVIWRLVRKNSIQVSLWATSWRSSMRTAPSRRACSWRALERS